MDETIQKKLHKFFSQFPLKKYVKGQSVIQPHYHLPGGHYLKSGNVKEYALSEDGDEVTIHIYAPNSYFPMTWIISGIENRYYFEAVNDVEIHMAPKEKITEFLKDNPDVLYDLTRRLLMGLDKLSLRIETLVFDNALQRVASILIFLAKHFGQEENDGILIKEIVTHRNIGALVGLTRETTSRTLEKLKKDGVISYKKDLIFLEDISKLKSLLSK